MKVFITGGAGYVGTSLTHLLLKKNYKVTVYDTFYFGDYLGEHKNLKKIHGDIRDIKNIELSSKDHDIFIHLACISNDPSYELNPNLSRSINFDCFEDMVLAAKKNKIVRFIYASTSSVYGVSEKKNVTEEHPLLPITDYNKYKGMCEPILLKHANDKFIATIIRPATVCGYSKRLRLDLSVNILTNHAYFKDKITVFGGVQKRPNINIKDMCNVYLHLIEAPKEIIHKQIFNVGYQNYTINELASIVKKEVTDFKKSKNIFNNEIEIINTNTDDIRSYHIDSSKIKKILKFSPNFTINDAVIDLCNAFYSNKIENTFDDTGFYNVKKITDIGL